VLAEMKNWEPLDGRYAVFGQRRPGPEPASCSSHEGCLQGQPSEKQSSA
jgi:hypothetical protein